MNSCYGALAPGALANGYAVVPCNGKKPYPTGWPNADKDQIEQGGGGCHPNPEVAGDVLPHEKLKVDFKIF